MKPDKILLNMLNDLALLIWVYSEVLKIDLDYPEFYLALIIENHQYLLNKVRVKLDPHFIFSI